MNKTLIEKAREFIKSGQPKDQTKLLYECILKGYVEALSAVKILAKDMYGGYTYNYELKSPAAFCLLAWKEEGLEALKEMAIEEHNTKNYSIAIQNLTSVAAGQLPNFIMSMKENKRLYEITSKSVGNPSLLKKKAQKCLNELIMNIDNEEDLGFYLSQSLWSTLMVQPVSAKNLFQSISRRWLAVGLPQIGEYEDLIKNYPKNENVLQDFLEQNPLFIDPLALRVWPKPDLHGKKEPDFVVQRSDNSYLVVEIEIPAKQIVTKQNQLSAATTHAITQVLDYHSFLMERFSETSITFPHFSNPECLVVIGKESILTEDQKLALQRENEHRPRVKIMGFDALLNQARSITENIIEAPVTVESIRLK